MNAITEPYGLGSDKIYDPKILNESQMRLAISSSIRSLLIPSLACLAPLLGRFCCLLALLIGVSTATTQAGDFDQRFTLNHAAYGFEMGLGQTVDIPACSNCPPPRTSHRFFSLVTSYERNLTGLTAEQSPWRGALFWHIEGGVAVITDDPGANEIQYLVNVSPLMVQYRLFAPERNWNPKFLGGIGLALTNWRDFGEQPLNSEHQFLIHLGAGIEFSGAEGSYSFDYRLLHVSNGGSGDPNIGINAHSVSITIPF